MWLYTGLINKMHCKRSPFNSEITKAPNQLVRENIFSMAILDDMQ